MGKGTATAEEALRIGWWHPAVTDFRLGLFQRMGHRFQLNVFAGQRGVALPPGVPVVFGARGTLSTSPNLLRMPARDMLAMVRMVSRSDVFVSSFATNAYTLLGCWLARRQRKPVVVWEEIQRLPSARWHAGVKTWLFKAMVRRIDAFFVMGDPQRECLLGAGVPADRIFQSIEAPATRYAEARAEPLAADVLPAGRFVLYLGRLITVKGVCHLLDAHARLQATMPGVSLVIAGDGPLRAGLEAQARSLGLQGVRFLGHVSNPAHKAWLLQNASVLAVTSIFNGDQCEGGPLVIPEALSAGTPVVCTEACGNTMQYVQAAHCGELVPPADADALAQALQRQLARPPARAEVLQSYDGFAGHDHQAERLSAAVLAAWTRRRR